MPTTLPATPDLRAIERYWEDTAPPVTHLVQRLRGDKVIHCKPAHSEDQALGIAAAWGVPGAGIHQRVISREQYTAITAGTHIGFQGGAE